MDNLIEQLLTLPNIAFCLAVWVLVWFQRKAIKMAWKGSETNKVYRELFLPMGPLGTGAIIAALITEYPYPEDFVGFWGRIAFGLLAGLISAHVYKMAKPFLPDNLKKAEDQTNNK